MAVESGTARVFIVDDHPAVREALALRIMRQADMDVCGEAADVAEAMQDIETTQPDAVVIDISLKTGSGIDLIQRIRTRWPEIRMLVWSMHDDSLYAERALRAGAHGYINKEHATGRIVDAIRQVLEGQVYLSPDASSQMLSAVIGKERRDKSPIESLSNRELQVFEMLGNGLATREIAARLNVSIKTVETHRQRIKNKLQVDTSTQLTRKATLWVSVERGRQTDG